LSIANLQEPVIFYREHELFTYKKYCGRVKDIQNVLKKYAPQIIGRNKMYYLLFRRFIKNSVYGTLYYSGLWNYSALLSNKSLSREDVELYSDILNMITEIKS
jgi:hypothetical protein